MQKVIMQKFSSVMSPLLMGSIQKEIVDGSFRQDLKPEFTLVSLLGITVFPFLAKPLIEAALGLKLTADTVKELAAHNTELFLHGVKANLEGGD